MRYLPLIVLLCVAAASPPLPTVTPKPVLHSPKGKEQVAALAKVALPKAIVIPPSQWYTNTLAWDNSNGTWTVGTVIEWKPTLLDAWIEVGRVTNQTRFTHRTTNAFGIYRAGAFWP